MDATAASSSTDWSSIVFYVFLALIGAAIIGAVLYVTVLRGNTIPSGAKEGFQGPVNGPSDIACGQESSEAIAIAEMFAQKRSGTEEGEPDLREFKMILGKLLCLKKDLMGTAQRVDATLYLPYQTTHDRQNPADVAARCFTASIPPRDLDIQFQTWRERAMFLLSRLCTSYNFSMSETEQAKNLFMAVWTDTFAVAKGACLTPDRAPAYGSPRDPKPYSDPEAEQGGPYKGYY